MDAVTKGGEVLKLSQLDDATQKQFDTLRASMDILRSEATDPAAFEKSFALFLDVSPSSAIPSKKLAATAIPSYFSRLPAASPLRKRGLGILYDLCEDGDQGVRVTAIRNMPLLCHGNTETDHQVANVLGQLLNIHNEDPMEVEVTRRSLQEMLEKDAKGALQGLFDNVVHKKADPQYDEAGRRKVVEFIRDEVTPQLSTLVIGKEDVEKTLESAVRSCLESCEESELAMFLDLLRPLPSCSSAENAAEVVRLLAERCRLKDVEFDTDAGRFILSTIDSLGPFFERGASPEPFLRYFIEKVAPRLTFPVDFLAPCAPSVSPPAAAASSSTSAPPPTDVASVSETPKPAVDASPASPAAPAFAFPKNASEFARRFAEMSIHVKGDVAATFVAQTYDVLKRFVQIGSSPHFFPLYLECFLYAFLCMASQAESRLNSVCGYKSPTNTTEPQNEVLLAEFKKLVSEGITSCQTRWEKFRKTEKDLLGLLEKEGDAATKQTLTERLDRNAKIVHCVGNCTRMLRLLERLTFQREGLTLSFAKSAAVDATRAKRAVAPAASTEDPEWKRTRTEDSSGGGRRGYRTWRGGYGGRFRGRGRGFDSRRW